MLDPSVSCELMRSQAAQVDSSRLPNPMTGQLRTPPRLGLSVNAD